MKRAKPIDNPRPSIFDNLNEKYPDLAETIPLERIPPKRRPWVGFALVACWVASALTLYLMAGDSTPAPRKAQEISLPEQSERAGEATPTTAKAQLPPLLPTPPFDPVETSVTTPSVDNISEVQASRSPPTLEPRLKAPTPNQPTRNPTPGPPDLPHSTPEVTIASPCEAADFRDPVKLHWTAPQYPEAARLAFQEGSVVVEAQVDNTGTVLNVRTLHSATPELDRAALDAVATWRFEPATCAGQPVAGRYRTALQFDLTPPEQNRATASTSRNDEFEPAARLFSPQPTYPPAAWVAAIEGDVTLRAKVDETGHVVTIEVLQGVSPELDAAAIEALEQWLFRPARQGGEETGSEQVLTFRFRR